MVRKIILDCDPGHDDAIAILLAGKSEKIDLLGITIASGNQTNEKTTANALNICNYLGINVPISSGCVGPIVKDKQDISPEIHGETGLDGPTFQEHNKKTTGIHAVNFIIDTVLKSKEKVTIVITGPMTNVAMAIRLEPSILKNIDEFVVMGGCYQLGNVTPAAEFNIYADADAAHIVFTSGVPVVMVGLDVTRKVLCLPSVIERMVKINNSASKLFEDLMKFFNKTQKEVFGWEGGPLHDPLTIAYLIDPSVLTTKEVYTEIDIRGVQSYGRTNCDFFGLSDKPSNTFIAVEVDVEKFWDIVEDGIKKY
ncbi:MAG: nucleoside hydrolase [Lachnospirales bacterium]